MLTILPIDRFLKTWNIVPKNTVKKCEVLGNSKAAMYVAFKIEHYLVIITLLVGKRYGVREKLRIVDPRKKFLLDQLVVNLMFTPPRHDMSDVGLLTLEDIRNEVKTNDVEKVCEKYLTEVIENIKQDHTHYLSAITSIIRHSSRTSSTSVNAISGGLPGLGKR